MPDDHAGVKLVTTGRYSEELVALDVDPSNSKLLYAAMAQDGDAAFYTSTDWAKTWKRIGDLPDGALKIYADPNSPSDARSVYIIGRSSVSVFKNGTLTHHKSAPGVERFIDCCAGFSKDGGQPIIYGVAPCKWRGKSLSGGVLVSTNGGESWKNASRDLARQAKGPSDAPVIRGIACCRTAPDVAYIGYKNFRFGGKLVNFGSAKTTDAGKTWQILVRETDPGKSAPNMKDAWLSERFGPIWGDAPRYLGVDPNNPNVCFTTDDGRTMVTRDGGKTWKACYSKKMGSAWTTTGLDVLTCYGAHVDPYDPKRVFISYTDIGLMVSDDGGISWKSATSKGVPKHWTNTTYWIEFDGKVKGRCWAVMTGIHDLPRPKMWRRTGIGRYNGGVCISEDSGRTWKPSTKGMPETACTHILMDPKSPVNARVLYVAGFGTGVWKSIDGGRSWALKNKGIEGAEPFAWRIALDRNGCLYLVVARRSDDGSCGNNLDGAVYRSCDRAETWEKLTLPRGVNGPNDLAVDPKDPKKLYLGAWGRDVGKEAVNGGLFVSQNAGKTWKCVCSKDQHVYGITIDPKKPNVVYSCTFASALRRSDDGGKSWKRVKGYNFKWGHRATPDPNNRGMIYVATFGGSVWYGPAKGDDKAAEDIVTPVVSYK